MKRLLAFAACVVLAIGVFLFLRYRLHWGQPKEEEQKTAGRGPREKSGPHDFPKGKGGLVRTSDYEKGALLDPNAPPQPLGEYAAILAKTLKKWQETKVDIDAQDTPLSQVLADLVQRYGLLLRIDPSLNESNVTIRVSDMIAIQALDLVLRINGGAWVVNQAGELWAAKKERLAQFSPPIAAEMAELEALRRAIVEEQGAEVSAEPELARTLRTKTFAGLRVDRTDIAGFINLLSQSVEINFVALPNDDPPEIGPVAAADNESVEAFLKRSLEPAGYDFYVSEDTVTLCTKEQAAEHAEELRRGDQARSERAQAEADFLKKSVNIGGENMSLRDLATELGKALAVPIVIDPKTWRRAATYSFNAIDRPAFEIVDIMRKGAPVEVTWRGGKLWFLAPEDIR